ncbi:MAG TPA: DPP IV N-terminal domain-containing protein, partial [Pyrinomonadaceae bacterium]|nr:DPP IV N-terminal domain-containing protein [Pyrinomonadaceae bacterium]
MNIRTAIKTTILLCIVSALFIPVLAQSDALTLENIYSNGVFRSRGFGPVRWMKDSAGYSTVETNKDLGGEEIVRYDAQTGRRSVLVAANKLLPAGVAKPLGIDDYEWSEDNSQILIFTNTKKVWRYNTRGDYWVLNIANGKLQQLGKGLDASTLMFAKFSPDGTRVGYVSKQNIYVEDIATGRVSQITTDGGGNIINGTFDWVYEEELDDRDGFRWSPDGKTIAYWQSDTKNIGTFYLIDNVSDIYSKPIPLPYPKVGTKLSAVKVGVIPAAGGKTKWLDVPGDPTNNYIARMDFIPNSNELMIQQLNRLQNTNKVWIA